MSSASVRTALALLLAAGLAASAGCDTAGDFCTSDSECGPALRCSIRSGASRGVCVYPEALADASRRPEAPVTDAARRLEAQGGEAVADLPGVDSPRADSSSGLDRPAKDATPALDRPASSEGKDF